MGKGWGTVVEQTKDGRGAPEAEALAFPGATYPAPDAMQTYSLILYYNTLRVFVENNGRYTVRNVVILGRKGMPAPFRVA